MEIIEKPPITADEFNPTSMADLNPVEQSDRFTIRVESYWEHFGEDPVGKQIIASKSLDTSGIEPYVRKFKVTQSPKMLPLGDIAQEDVGYVMLVNLEGTKLQWNPTDEEREDIGKRVVLVNDDFELYPYGMPFLGQPSPKSPPMTVKCLQGEAVIQCYIFPR